MPNILSDRHVECIINDHRIEGWADESPPIDFPEIEMIEAMYGRDGTLYGAETGRQGGEVTLKLLPASRSAIRFMRWFAERQRGGRITFEGTYGDNELGYSMQMKGGLFRMLRPMIVSRQVVNVGLVFEQLIPNFDGVEFDPAPQASTGGGGPVDDISGVLEGLIGEGGIFA